MGSVTYAPPPGETQNTETRGIRFEAGKAVTINDPLWLRKLSGNSHFQVDMSDEEREAAEQQSQQQIIGTVQVTAGAAAHRPYYSSTSAPTDDPEARAGAATVAPYPPTSAVAAGGGLNTSTLGDLPTPEQIYEKYSTDNPTDSMIPGDPPPPSNVNEGVMQVQADRQQQAEQQQQQAAPKRGPGRPPKARPEQESGQSGPTFEQS